MNGKTWTEKFILVISTLFITAGVVVIKSDSPEYFQFEYNPYAVLTLIAGLIYIVLFIALSMKSGYAQARLWFSVFLFGGLMLCLGEFTTRLSTSPAQVVFWSHFVSTGVSLIPVGFYMFVRHYTDQHLKTSSMTAPIAVLAGSGILMAFSLGKQPLSAIEAASGFWGYSIPLSPNFVLLTVWLSVIIIICILQLVKYTRSVHSQSIKRQTRLIIIGSITSLACAMLFDVLPRSLGYNIFPTGVFIQLVLPLFVIYAIFKYNAFSVDLSSSANDIINTLSEAVVVTDSSYKILSVNKYAAEMLGYEETKLVGRPVVRLFDPAKFRSITNQMNHAPASSHAILIESVEITNAAGETLYVNVAVSRLEGDVAAYVLVLTNVTEMKRYIDAELRKNTELEAANQAFGEQQRAIMNLLEDSQDLGEQLRLEKLDVEKKVEVRTREVQAERTRLEASINSLTIGFLIIDTKQKTISANKAMGNIIGVSEADGDFDVDTLHEKIKHSIDIRSAIAGCLDKGKITSKEEVQFGEKVIRIFIAPVFSDTSDKASLGAVILIEDITELKAVERSRDEFFSIASHELRTPLTAIRGNTRMILDYYKADLKDPMLVEMVDDIHDSSIRLITIVNDFLDTSRLEQGKISFDITDFDSLELVEQISQEFKAGDINPDLYIKINAPTVLPLVTADKDRLKQTVINMIGNALKFTEKGGVTISLRPVGKMMTIDVKDTGKGIPVESKNLLFRKFQQASNNILTRDSTRSTGLGLYISKLLMQGMGGKIYLKSSQVGKGSTFTVEVPLSKLSADIKK